MPFFKNVFKSKDGSRSASKAGRYADAAPPSQPQPRWEEAWSRMEVAPQEVRELIHVCTHEMKSRALDMPFLLLPFRPNSDQSTARNFVRNYFKASYEGTGQFTGHGLQQELRLTEPLVLCSIIKWCWSRLPGGVVTWDAYELFRIGESDSNFASHAFDTFIPLSVESEDRKQIIIDFFDLLAAIAARGKSNGMGGRKLSRMAAWWAFEYVDDAKGFDGGYRAWERAADASSHLFFAYLRSLCPDPTNVGAIETLPRSLQALLQQTEYPPETPALMQTTTTKVVMIVDSVSPTPFALLRRAKQFEYRDDDMALQAFSSYEDPVRALTDECRRVLNCVASTNQSAATLENGLGAGMVEPSWSQFEDIGFSGLLDTPSITPSNGSPQDFSNLGSGPRSRNTDFGRPTTPSWADFLSTGFADDNKGKTAPPPLLLPPDKVLPPIGDDSRVHSSQSHMRHGLQTGDEVEPGELASITQFDLDETFWWVWMTSLAAEEPTNRKAIFGRCALIETRIGGSKWLVMEEQVKGAAVGPEDGAYIAEKKGRFSFRTRLGRRKSTGKKPAPKEPYNRTTSNTPSNRTNIAPDQQARVQAAAQRLKQQEVSASVSANRRGRLDDSVSMKTNSVLTLQPHLLSEAGPAMKWDKKFGEGAKDRDALRAQYLGDLNAGKGSQSNLAATANGTKPTLTRDLSNRDLPLLPKEEAAAAVPAREATPSPAPPPSSPPAAAAHVAPQKKPIPFIPVSMDEKPVPADQLDTHPAFRKPVPEREPMAPFKQEEPEEGEVAPLPESVKRSPPRKLKKNGSTAGTSGFRRLFGKKKTDAARSGSVQEDSRARSYTPEPETGRFTPQSERVPSPLPEPAPAYSAQPSRSVRAESPAMEPSPAVSAVGRDYREQPYPAVPTPDMREQQEANQAFSRFDQGPMNDMPAFVPDDSDNDGELTPHAPTHPVHHSSHEPHRDVVTPTKEAPPRPSDDISEQSLDLGYQMHNPQDRWAQIRRNAAERAARLSEEQATRSRSHSARTDEEETSGEETIESRVARIKARVAELTGNVDGQPVR